MVTLEKANEEFAFLGGIPHLFKAADVCAKS
jgi:hypothetical protein